MQSRLRRTEYGYEGISKFDSHIYAFDPPGKSIADYAYAEDAEGHFAHGTDAFAVDGAARLFAGLHRKPSAFPPFRLMPQTLTDHLKKELPRLGYTMMTPLESTTPLVAYALENARGEARRGIGGGESIAITTSKNRFRLSPSVFNDENDRTFAIGARARLGNKGLHVGAELLARQRVAIHHVAAPIAFHREVAGDGRIEMRAQRIVGRAAIERVIGAGRDQHTQRWIDLDRVQRPGYANPVGLRLPSRPP